MWDKIYRVYMKDNKVYESFDLADCVSYLRNKYGDDMMQRNYLKDHAWFIRPTPYSKAIPAEIKEEAL